MSTALKPGMLRRLSLGAALIAVAATPVAFAPTASAATTAHGCTVNPLAPVYAGRDGAGFKQVRHNFVVNCFANRSIEVQQMFFEDDSPPNPDDFTGTVIKSGNFPVAAIATRGETVRLPDTDAGAERIYQRTRFRVSVGGGAPSAWTAPESSGILTINN